MSGPYSPGALRAKYNEIAEAAIASDLERNRWLLMDNGEFLGVGWEPRLPDPRKGPTGDMIFTFYEGDGRVLPGMTQVNHSDPNDGYGSTEWRFNPWNDLYDPWYTRIRTAFEGWDEIPEASGFDPLVDAARDAVAKTTLESGIDQRGGDLTADGDLYPALKFIDRWIGPSAPSAYTSGAISAFDWSYGAARQATVIGNQRQAMIAVGLALAGAQNLWLKAGGDIMQLADHAKTAFENLKADSFDLGIITAFTGVANLFAVGPLAPLGKALGVVDKVVDGSVKVNQLVDKITPKDSAVKVDPMLEGGSADEVYDNLVKVLGQTSTAIWYQEQALIAPLNLMFEDEVGDKRAYHIQPEPEDSRDLVNASHINVDSDALVRALGSAIPTVVAILVSAAGDLNTASRSLPWLRPGNIGYGYDGAFPEVNRLASFTSELAMSSGKQLLKAERTLASALGLLEQADAQSASILKGVTADLKDVPLGFPAPPRDPRAPQQRLPSGNRLPI